MLWQYTYPSPHGPGCPRNQPGNYFTCWISKRQKNHWSEAIQQAVTDQRTGPAPALPSQALASPLCLWKSEQTWGFRESSAEGLQVDMLQALRRKMCGQPNCSAHFSTANETLFGAVLHTSYFLFSHFRVHWTGKVSPCGTNLTQH